MGSKFPRPAPPKPEPPRVVYLREDQRPPKPLPRVGSIAEYHGSGPGCAVLCLAFVVAVFSLALSADAGNMWQPTQAPSCAGSTSPGNGFPGGALGSRVLDPRFGRWPHQPSLPYAIGATGRYVLGMHQRHEAAWKQSWKDYRPYTPPIQPQVQGGGR